MEAKFVILKLIDTYSGRYVTTDNSLSLASKLLEKGTTLFDTVRTNKKELPQVAKQRKDSLPWFSFVIYRTNNATLTIYKSKPSKKGILLNTKHYSVNIEKD